MLGGRTVENHDSRREHSTGRLGAHRDVNGAVLGGGHAEQSVSPEFEDEQQAVAGCLTPAPRRIVFHLRSVVPECKRN
jgi:hypothetical protein